MQLSELKTIRKGLMLNQETLARLADVSRITIANIESGKNKNPEADTINAIEEALAKRADEVSNRRSRINAALSICEHCGDLVPAA